MSRERDAAAAGFTIRQLEESDLGELALLMTELGESAHTSMTFSATELAPLLDAMRKQPDIYLNLVAEADGSLVGFISVVFYRSFFHRVGTALINELVVAKPIRGRGVGSALVDAARREAVRRGMDEIEVGTEIENARAQALYRRHGFTEEYMLLGQELSQPDISRQP